MSPLDAAVLRHEHPDINGFPPEGHLDLVAQRPHHGSFAEALVAHAVTGAERLRWTLGPGALRGGEH